LCRDKDVKISPATSHGGTWGERKYSSYSFTTSALDGMSGQRHAPAALYPRGKDPGTHWIGGWVRDYGCNNACEGDTAEMAGHLIRMNDQQPAKRVFILKPEGSRTRRRPCIRCADNIDIYGHRTIGESNWKAMAVNRVNWGRLLRKAMAHKRLSCQR
jgi:hypothetical protein